MRLSPVFLVLTFTAWPAAVSPQESSPDPQTVGESPSPDVPPAAPQPPPPPPDGILPVSEIARLVYSPGEQPRVAFFGEKLVVVTASGAVEARDAASGEFSWKLGLPGETLYAPAILRREPLEIIVSSRAGHLLVIDVASGEIRREIALPISLALEPVVVVPFIYAGTPSGDIVAFDFETGEERFRVATGEEPAAFAFAAGLLVVSGSERTLTAIDTVRGETRWAFRGRAGFLARASFPPDAKKLYIGDDAGEFYCLSAESGKVRFRWSTGAAIRSQAVLEGSLVYVTSFGNNIYSYDGGGGAEQWRTSLPGRPASAPTRFYQRLVAATLDGILIEVVTDRGQLGKSYGAPAELSSAPAFFVAPFVPPPAPAPGTAPATESTPRLAGPEEAPVPSADTAPDAAPIPPTERAEDEGKPSDATEEVEPADVTPTAPPWYMGHRIALALRTGEVLLLGHHPPAPAPPPEAEADPAKPPGAPTAPEPRR